MKKILILILVICIMAAIGCGSKTTKNSDIIEQEIEENITKENEQMTEPMKTELSETDNELQNMNTGNSEALREEDNITERNDYTVNTGENEEIIEDAASPTDLTDNKVSDEEHGNDNEPQNAEKTATISIEGPKDVGVILESTIVVLGDNDTVFDITKRVTRERKIHLSFRGSGSMAYIEGIDNLYEFDRGPTSGWLYSVNGEYYGKGCGTHTVSDGDVIKWAYTLDLGKDLGAPN